MLQRTSGCAGSSSIASVSCCAVRCAAFPWRSRFRSTPFLGVALHLVASEAGECVALSLAHRDPALSVPLFSESGSDDVIAEWQLWARTLRLPLLVADRGGNLREPFERM